MRAAEPPPSTPETPPPGVMPCITFVVVNYHTARLLPGCLGALVAAAGDVTHEIVVVDNSTSGDEAAALRALDPRPDRLLFNEANVGFGAACNRAIAEAAGEFVWLVNPDARLAPGSARPMLEAFRREARLGAASPPVVGADGRLQRAAQADPSPANYWRHYSLFSDFRRGGAARSGAVPETVDWLIGAALCLRRAALPAGPNAPFDPGYFLYFEDADLCRRLRAERWGVALVGEVAAAEHTAQQSSGANPSTKERTLIEFFRSFARYAEAWFAPLERLRLRRQIGRDMRLRLLLLPWRRSLGADERAARRRAYRAVLELVSQKKQAPDKSA